MGRPNLLGESKDVRHGSEDEACLHGKATSGRDQHGPHSEDVAQVPWNPDLTESTPRNWLQQAKVHVDAGGRIGDPSRHFETRLSGWCARSVSC